MAKRSPRITEMKEKTELSCMPGFFGIRQNHASPKMILNGKPLKKHVVDSPPRKLVEHRASFDEECRKIQNEADFENAGNRIREDMSIEKLKSRQIIVKGQRHTYKTDSEIFNHIIKHHKRARKNSQKESSIYQLPSTPSEISSNNLTVSAILEENRFSEGFRKFNQLDEINMRQVQMSAKAFVDQMFLDRKFISKEGTSSECKPFSNALEVLNSNKDLFMELLRQPDSLLSKCVKNLQDSQRKKATIKSVLDGSDFETTVRALMEKGKKRFSEEGDSDKIVILKPALVNSKCSENVSCHCSSMHTRKRLSERGAREKPASFSLKEIKRRLKYTFGSSQSEPNLYLMDQSANRDSVDSSDNVQMKGEFCKKDELNSNTQRKKLDLSSVKFPKKQEFDVILEAKKHLSARLKNLNAVENTTSERLPKTLGRILSSPERDFLPLSPRRDSQYYSGSAQMRFRTYSAEAETSCRIPSGKQRTCLSPLRQNKEVTLDNLDTRTGSFLIVGTDEQMQDMKSNDESKIMEMNRILLPDTEISEILVPEVSSGMQSSDTSEMHEEEGSVLHSTVDSLSENEITSMSTVEDFPSTPSSVYQLDMVESIKYQEEHQSPVSVLEQFFTEDANSPTSITLRTVRQRIQPHRLSFDGCSFEPLPQDLHLSTESCIDEKYYISHYVHLVLKVSCLSWDELSEIKPQPETLLCESLFDEVEFQPTDIYFDPKLLFDHINEVLLQIYQCHFCSPPWISSIKSKIRPSPVEKLVLDEIMKEVDFYLLPRTEKRTLNQLVSKDVEGSRTWLDIRNDTEEIVIDICEDFLEESILDMLLEFHS